MPVTATRRSDSRRADLLDRIADHVLSHGLAGSSLRPLAAAAGVSDRMLLYYFKDKPELIEATLETIVSRLAARLIAKSAPVPQSLTALTHSLADIMLSDELWPYMCVWLELASLSARGDPLFARIGEMIARGFLAWGEGQLEGNESVERKTDAARLLLSIEGLVLLKSLGLEAEARQAL